MSAIPFWAMWWCVVLWSADHRGVHYVSASRVSPQGVFAMPFAMPSSINATESMFVSTGTQFIPGDADADDDPNDNEADNCPITHGDLRIHLRDSLYAWAGPRDDSVRNGGWENDMWAAVVTRDGVVCSVARSSKSRFGQMSVGRLLAATKAYTANLFSTDVGPGGAAFADGVAVSTCNLYEPTQPGGPMYGLERTHPLDASTAYAGPTSGYGTSTDPLVGKRVGGISAVAGGLPLFKLANGGRKLIGALGVGGDTSCADHNVAWRIRHKADLDWIPGGQGPDCPGTHDPHCRAAAGHGSDGCWYGVPAVNGFGHPLCAGDEHMVSFEIESGAVLGMDAPPRTTGGPNTEPFHDETTAPPPDAVTALPPQA